MKKIVVFFSRAGENYNVGNLEVGNTEVVANYIKDKVGADSFKIEAVEIYPDSYNECIKVSKDESDKNARPQIKNSINNIDEYDTVYLGYPIWWGKMPMILYTFLELYDLSGKTIKPFCTHEGNGLGSTVNEIARLARGANVEPGFEIQGSTIKDSLSRIDEWLKM